MVECREYIIFFVFRARSAFSCPFHLLMIYILAKRSQSVNTTVLTLASFFCLALARALLACFRNSILSEDLSLTTENHLFHSLFLNPSSSGWSLSLPPSSSCKLSQYRVSFGYLVCCILILPHIAMVVIN